MKPLTPLGAELKKAATERNIKIGDMCRNLGVSCNYFNDLINGKRNTSDDKFLKLLRYLGIDKSRHQELKNLAQLSRNA